MRSAIRRTTLICACLLAGAAAAGPIASAAESEGRSGALRPLRQIDIDIAAIVADEQSALADLHARFEAATDLETALEVQREIRQLKVDTQIALCEAQVRHARRIGNEEQAAKLAARIERLRNPEAARQALIKPEPRPEQGGAR